MIEKTAVPKLIVFNSGVALPAGATRLYNPATSADVLAVNGVGIYEPVAGSGSPKASTAVTAATAQYIEVIKRRDTTGDKSPLPPRHYEKSGRIPLNGHKGVEWSGATAELGTSQSIIVGAAHGAVGAITPVDNATYRMTIVADGAKTDKIYGSKTQPTLSVIESFGEFGVSPELSTLSSTQQARDYVISKLVDKHNVLSSNQGDTLSIAVAIATDDSNLGGATAYDSTAIAALTIGDYLTIGYNGDNSPVNVLITADVKNALAAMIAAANTKAGVATSSIVQYALPTANNLTGLSATAVAGGQGLNNARIDMFGLIAVDIDRAYYDESFDTKRRITLGLDPDGGFDSTVYIEESSAAKVRTGHGSDIKQLHKNIEHYKQYSSSKDYGAMHIAYPDDIVETGYYDVYTLYYDRNLMSTGGFPAVAPHKLILAIPNFTVGDASSNSFYTGTANAQKAAVEAIMNAYVARVGLPAVAL